MHAYSTGDVVKKKRKKLTRITYPTTDRIQSLHTHTFIFIYIQNRIDSDYNGFGQILSIQAQFFFWKLFPIFRMIPYIRNIVYVILCFTLCIALTSLTHSFTKKMREEKNYLPLHYAKGSFYAAPSDGCQTEWELKKRMDAEQTAAKFFILMMCFLTSKHPQWKSSRIMHITLDDFVFMWWYIWITLSAIKRADRICFMITKIDHYKWCNSIFIFFSRFSPLEKRVYGDWRDVSIRFLKPPMNFYVKLFT